MLYQFEGIGIGYVFGEFKRVDPDGYDLVKFKETYTKWNDVFAARVGARFTWAIMTSREW
jgi:hypothetical protein